ncbi:MAG: division/cell wall cluster transcriptional repressor MraZ [Planctomycetes bacterium]|nr:division/cell wall cluster transcriptional repressor MraZ [Planctomycetota bacterium]
MLLTGTYQRSLDEKLRVAIPKPLREALGRPGLLLYVTPGTDGSLAIYTQDALDELAHRLAQASPAAKDVQAFRRIFYARAQAVELDRQGRLRIPPELAQWGLLDKNVVLIGAGGHLELWDRGHWEAYSEEKQAHFDELAEAAFGLPASSDMSVPMRKETVTPK